MSGSDVTRTVEAVWRIESARLIAGIARLVRDIARNFELRTTTTWQPRPTTRSTTTCCG